MQIVVTSGTGEGPTPLAAFDAALLSAGVANYNLIYLSSVIPPGSSIELRRFVQPSDEYGHRLYLVAARHHEHRLGSSAWAGLGWTQAEKTGRGLFVELHGTSKSEVEEAIDATLGSMIAKRGQSYGPVHSEIVGVECHGKPVCALVVAVYKSAGWDD